MAELMYVDEQQTQVDQVLRSAVASGQFTQNEVKGIIPSANINETIEAIRSSQCKVLIAELQAIRI